MNCKDYCVHTAELMTKRNDRKGIGSGFVNRRLEVQFLSPAPTFQALTFRAISLESSGVITVLER
jgi:hypothetical protein